MDFSVYEIHEAGDGAIWVASSAGVLRFGEGKATRVTDFRSLIESLCADTQGKIWIARGGGLECLSGPARLALVPRQGSLPREPRSLYCDPAGVFWIACNDGLTELKDGVATFYRKSDGPSGFVNSFLSDSQGNLWIGAYAGISRFNGHRFVNESKPEEPAYHIYAFAEDHERNLWVALDHGLERLTPKLFRTYTTKDDPSLNNVVSVCASRDGSIWIGAWGGGLNHLVADQLTCLRASAGLSSDFVLALAEGHDGSLWAGADYGAPLNRILNGRISHYGRKEGFIAGATTTLFEDEQGALWIGTRDGLYCLRDQRFTLYTTREGLSHDKINVLCGGAEGVIWIGTDAGLTCWSGGHFVDFARKIPALRCNVLSLFADADRTLWIGTKDRGLLQLKEGGVRAFTTTEGLFSDSLYAILADDRGNLWFDGSRGVFRAAKAQFETNALGTQIICTHYGELDGITSSGQQEEIQPSACRDTAGRLWFRTTQGAAVVDPAKITTNKLPPPVFIRNVIADGKPLRPGAAAGLRPPLGGRGDSVIPPLTVRPGRGELEIHYTALSFRAPEKNLFRYRLEGVDLNWVEARARREAYYNNLRPGAYQFQVIACNNDGVWNQTGALLNLILLPHFWQTWWFEGAEILAAVGLVGGAALYVARRRLQRQLILLEQQRAIERERARIARDMHDELEPS